MNAALLLLLICPNSPDVAEADEAVAAGREALDQFWVEYPWYDAETDGVRRVELPKPWEPNRLSNVTWPGAWLQWLAWVVIGLLLVALVYLLLRAFWGKRPWTARDAAAGPTSDRDDADRIEALPLPVRAGRADLLGEARRHYGRGNFAQAIVYLFSHELVELDKRQIIRLTRGKTNRQYLREVGPRTTLSQLVEQTMVAFEDVFFGHHPLDRARFESCWSRLGEFESLAAEVRG